MAQMVETDTIHVYTSNFESCKLKVQFEILIL